MGLLGSVMGAVTGQIAPRGAVPDSGLGHSDDLVGMLGGLLKG